jgi:hypothetical protein
MAKPISHIRVVPKWWARVLLPKFMRKYAYFYRQRGGRWWRYRIPVGTLRYLGKSNVVRFYRIRDCLRYNMIRYRGGNARTLVAD